MGLWISGFQDRVLKGLVDNKETKMQGGRREMGLCGNQYIFEAQLHMVKNLFQISLLYCVIEQLYVHIVPEIHVSIAYGIIRGRGACSWWTPKSISQGSLKFGLGCPRRAHYVVGGGVQEFLGGAIVHHEGLSQVGCKYKDTLSCWGVSRRIWVSTPSSNGWHGFSWAS